MGSATVSRIESRHIIGVPSSTKDQSDEHPAALVALMDKISAARTCRSAEWRRQSEPFDVFSAHHLRIVQALWYRLIQSSNFVPGVRDQAEGPWQGLPRPFWFQWTTNTQHTPSERMVSGFLVDSAVGVHRERSGDPSGDW